MDDDAVRAFGAVMVVLSALLERSSICSRAEFANMLGNVAVAAEISGSEHSGQAAYIGAWAHMLQSGAYDTWLGNDGKSH
ncbi:hypothetical protein [Novosphingobium terrae]|uniref:hypothetical protein n=1 Tax=Novosphingobium terrae TaxID=2726189 RepID=UPI001980FAAB|nr:hypothetical protein [Novosphingobium terrae]